MKRRDMDNALQWFEQMPGMDVSEAAIEAHRRWWETPANAEAYTKIERVFWLARALAGGPEITRPSEETHKRINRYSNAPSANSNLPTRPG